MKFDAFGELKTQIAKHTSACAHHPPFDRGALSPLEADAWEKLMEQCSPEARWSHRRWLGLNDLYYLCVHILEIKMLKTQWHLDGCREMERECDGIIDLWSRGTGKSAVKTFGKVIQEILRNPDLTFGIFSHTRPIAKDFLKKIKTTFEGHADLKSLYPDVLYDDPQSESPQWSLDRGIVVKRKSVTRGEASVEAWGLVDGQPTGKHFDVLVYDDIQKEKVSDYMLLEIESAFDTSLGLSADKPARWWACGVFFRGGSVYESLIERGTATPRVRPGMFEDGSSPIWNEAQVRGVVQTVKNPGTLACEYYMDPTKKVRGEGFDEAWKKFHNLTSNDLNGCNVYIVVDPGKGKQNNKASGMTSMQVIALRADKNYYLVDGIVGPMGLDARTAWLFSFHRQYNMTGRVKCVGYESYGLQSDIEHIRGEQERESYRFDIVPLSAHVDKDDRIEWLIGPYKNGEFHLPTYVPKRMIAGQELDFMDYFLTREYSKWPATKTKDCLDCQAWIMYRKEPDWMPTFPEGYGDDSVKRGTDFDTSDGSSGTWMSG